MDSTSGTHAYELSAQPSQSLSQRVMIDFFTLTRSELELAAVGLERKARVGAEAGTRLALASLFGVASLVTLGTALSAVLSRFMKGWLAPATAAAALAIPALALARSGRASLARLSGELVSSLPDPNSVGSRAESARRDLDRDVAALAQRSSSPSPVRDAILSDMAMTLGSVIQASKGKR